MVTILHITSNLAGLGATFNDPGKEKKRAEALGCLFGLRC